MISNNDSQIEYKLNQSNEDLEIDLKNIFTFFYRNKKSIALYGLAGVFLGAIVAFGSKRIWEGEFQIVLELNRDSPALKTGSASPISIGFGRKFDPLETEVGILKSPSVLMNIFEFVKNQKVSKTKNSAEKQKIQSLKFIDWRKNNLKVGLQKSTSILNLSYRDSDKSLIIPVLKKVSETYQEYSGKQRLRNLELSENFFREQINLYREKSIDSLRKSQQFAIDQDLSLLSGDSEIDIDIPNSINIENIRVSAANQIRNINEQLDQIQNFSEDSEQIMYLASTIPSMQDLYNKLKNIDTYIAQLRVTYTDFDKSIKDQIKQREFLIELINRQVKGVLIAQRNAAEARLKSAERPQGVIIEYRQLLNNAAKDKATLDDLENQYRAILLEKARIKDPWQLITTPTLYPSPVAPRKKRIIAFGILSGLFLGTFTSLILEKKKDILYSTKEMQSIFNVPIIDELAPGNLKYLENKLNLFLTSPDLKNKEDIALLKVGNLDKLFPKEAENIITKSFKNRNFLITDKFFDVINFKKIIIISSLGLTKKEELIDIKSKLIFHQKQPIGIISLKNNIN